MICKWIIGAPDENKVKELVTKGGLSVLTARALVCSGVDTVEKAAEFFGQTDGDITAFYDPFLIKDMDKACDIINGAVESGELICVYGDYDCDGITAAAVLSGYLTDIGGNVTVYINERDEGYGMNLSAVEKLAEMGVKLIVTVDNGISAIEEAARCRELGITLVITDHHRAGEALPDAAAVVDPHRKDCPSPYKELCGCGLALKVIAAMEGGDMDCAAEQYSDLAAVATVADVVPLTGENREIVRRGLHYLENTENIGLRALMEKAGMKPPYSSTAAAFGIAPRINAAGRIGSPMEAYKLLCCEDGEESEEYAERINGLNTRRREFEAAILTDIAAQIKADPALLDGRAVILKGKGWHHGVVGIAAARCTEKFGKPVFLMSMNEGENEFRGSARSIEGFNIFDALTHAGELLTKYGGHPGAGGFSLPEENFTAFGERIEEYGASHAEREIHFTPFIRVCSAVSPEELTVENVENLDVLEPFGEGNPRPVFLLGGAAIKEIIPLSKGAHTKLTLTAGGKEFTGLMFGTKTEEFPYNKGDEVNLLVCPEINEYGGNRSVNLRITDIRKSGLVQQKLIAAEDTYFRFRRGEKLDAKLISYITPERNELAAVYRGLKDKRISPPELYGTLGMDINYCKFLLCLDIFSETGLIAFDRCAGLLSIIPDAPKAELESSATMKKLRAMR